MAKPENARISGSKGADLKIDMENETVESGPKNNKIENPQEFIQKQDEIVEAELTMIETGANTVNEKVKNVTDPSAARAFIDEKESIENDSEQLTSNLHENLEKLDETNKSERSEKSEINMRSIKDKIQNNEMLSDEEDEYLSAKIEEIQKKQIDGIASAEDIEIVMMYQEAVYNGLTPRSSEINESLDENIEEIKAFNGKSNEEKDGEINERLEKIKNSGIELSDKAEEAERRMNELKKQLKERYDEFTKMEEDLEKIRDSEGVDERFARTLKETISSLKNIYSDKLHIEYYEYWIKYLKGGKNVESLYDSHAKHNISMNQLEKLGGDLESDLAGIEKGEAEVLSRWAQFIKDHPKAGLALLTAAIAAGIILSPYLVKMIGAPELAKVGTDALAPLIKPTALLGAEAVGSLASLTGSAGLAGIFLLLMNSEKIDNAMESIWGKKIPSWASWGLRKKGERK